MPRVCGLTTLATWLVCLAVTLPKRPPWVRAFSASCLPQRRAGVLFNVTAAPTEAVAGGASAPSLAPLCQASGACQATRTYLPAPDGKRGAADKPTSIFLLPLCVHLLGKVHEPPARGLGQSFKRAKAKPRGAWPKPRPGPGCPCPSLGRHQTLA